MKVYVDGKEVENVTEIHGDDVSVSYVPKNEDGTMMTRPQGGGAYVIVKERVAARKELRIVVGE